MSTPKESTSFLKWALDRKNPADPKYATEKHAVFVTLTGTILFLAIAFGLRYTAFGNEILQYPMR